LKEATEQGRQAKVRSDFTAMLWSHPEIHPVIKHYTRWQTAFPLIEGETVYRSADTVGPDDPDADAAIIAMDMQLIQSTSGANGRSGSHSQQQDESN
jgi:hypothetical protein